MDWAFQVQKITWFLSNCFILCILKVYHASQWAYHWSQRTASSTEEPSQGPLVPQRRLIRITTNRIFLPEAWQIWNKIPSSNVGLKSSLFPLLEEWVFARSVIFLYRACGPKAERYSLLWQIDRNSRPLSPVFSLLCLSPGLAEKKYQHGDCSMLHSSVSLSTEIGSECECNELQRAVVSVVWAPVHQEVRWNLRRISQVPPETHQTLITFNHC